MTESLTRLVACFRRLPGVGTKTAVRYAYSVIENDEEFANEFSSAILDAKKNIHFCAECGNYTEDEVCEFCRTRNKKVICVVAQPKDIAPFEKTGSFDGVYHVLHGTIDFRNGVGVDDIRIKELLARLVGVEEVIIATNPNIEGETTALYLAKLLEGKNVSVTRLAYGLPMGASLDYADSLTLSKALEGRKKL